jgi:hypothetical protein
MPNRPRKIENPGERLVGDQGMGARVEKARQDREPDLKKAGRLRINSFLVLVCVSVWL